MTDKKRFGYYKNILKTVLHTIRTQSAHVTCCHAASSFRESEILYFILTEEYVFRLFNNYSTRARWIWDEG